MSEGRQKRVAVAGYSHVFRFERRIYRFGEFRIPLPYGLPVRGVIYGFAAFGLVLIATKLPVVGAVLAALPPPFRYVILPIALAVAAVSVSPDGLPVHSFVAVWVRRAVVPKTTLAGRQVTGEGAGYRFACDLTHTAPLGRRGSLKGPATVLIRRSGRLKKTANTVRYAPTQKGQLKEGKVLRLKAGHRLEVG